MKKLFVLLVLLLAVGFVSAAETVLDEMDSTSGWDVYTSGYNPTVTVSTVVSNYDLSNAIKTDLSGNTVMYCDTKYMYKTFDVGASNSGNTDLKAYLEFASSQDTYNFPYITVYLLDSNDASLGYHIWYGKDMVGSYYQNIINNDPTHFTMFDSDKGFFTMDLSNVGQGLDFTKVRVYISNYACVGTNSIVMDHIVFAKSTGGNGGGNGGGVEVPEFGVIAALVAVIGAFGIFMINRK
jgi:hypothetical protein